jgi:5-methylthioribose kinase
MISTKEASLSLSNGQCWACKKIMDGDINAVYYIWANHKDKPSIKIIFHKECFEGVAGKGYMFEGY